MIRQLIATALVSGYRLPYWIAAAIMACALAVVVLLLRSDRPAKG